MQNDHDIPADIEEALIREWNRNERKSRKRLLRAASVALGTFIVIVAILILTLDSKAFDLREGAEVMEPWHCTTFFVDNIYSSHCEAPARMGSNLGWIEMESWGVVPVPTERPLHLRQLGTILKGPRIGEE